MIEAVLSLMLVVALLSAVLMGGIKLLEGLATAAGELWRHFDPQEKARHHAARGFHREFPRGRYEDDDD